MFREREREKRTLHEDVQLSSDISDMMYRLRGLNLLRSELTEHSGLKIHRSVVKDRDVDKQSVN